jgi:phosphate:Na+ symporter
MTFRQSMGVVLGANIGTTVSSQILAMDIGKYSPVLLLVGFILLFVSKSGKLNNTAKVIMYFGVLFFGLFTMEKAVEPLRDNTAFHDLMAQTENPVSGSITGAIVTLVIQSSSATVGMAIILAKKGLLGLGGAIAIMLGAELGTCSDTLIATIRGSREALKTGLFHLSFNILSIAIGLTLFKPFIHFVQWVSQGAPIERAVANAHMLFNIAGVCVFVWALPLFEKFLNSIVKKPEVGTGLQSPAV